MLPAMRGAGELPPGHRSWGEGWIDPAGVGGSGREGISGEGAWNVWGRDQEDFGEMCMGGQGYGVLEMWGHMGDQRKVRAGAIWKGLIIWGRGNWRFGGLVAPAQGCWWGKWDPAWGSPVGRLGVDARKNCGGRHAGGHHVN